MFGRWILILILALSFVGCASVRKPSVLNNLEIKVAQLERKVESRDQEIESLKYELKELNDQIAEIEISQAENESYQEPKKTIMPKVEINSNEDKIIRVPVSAQDIQRALKNAGYYDGEIDGKIGKKTKQAISNFQKDSNLETDGIVGKKTWEQMKGYLD